MPQHRERDVAAHRQAADDGVVNVQRVEQIDDVAGVVVDRDCAGGSPCSAVEAAEVRRDDAPAALGERQLRLPHAGVEGKA